MKDLKQLAYKLQTALNLEGLPVVISEKRFWSKKYKRPITKYKAKIRWPDKYAELIISTYSAAELVKALADKYKEIKP